MRRPLLLFVGSIFMLLFSACSTNKQAFYTNADKNWKSENILPKEGLDHTLYMVGDVGDGELRAAAPVLRMLQSHLIEEGENSSVSFLGNNIPKIRQFNSKEVTNAEPVLRSITSVLENYKGQVYFLAGENEWGRGSSDGLQIRLWEENFLEKELNNEELFFPGDGCGEPYKIKIHKDLVFIFIDSEWWLTNWQKVDNINEDCEIKDRFAFLLELESMFKKYDNDQIVVMMSHPLYSNGPHGGNYPISSHLLPFPGIGSLVTFFREIGVSTQDVNHRNYRLLREEIIQMVNKKPFNKNVIFVGAHDNSLQYHSPETGLHRQHFIVSGSMAGADYTRQGKDALFAYSKQGFSKLYFYSNGEVWLDFWTYDEENKKGELSFRKKIVSEKPTAEDEVEEEIFETMTDSFTISAASIYEVSGIRKVGFGNKYRGAWETPITVPVFNLEDEFSDMEIVKLGGGMSSKSLRLEASNGKQYVLRSINKSVRKGLPEILRQTVAENIIQDLKSGSHPYAAFVIPPLADAVGIYHANPKLYYLPRQKRLGELNDMLGGELYLFEERPDDEKWKDESCFGKSEEIISYMDMLKKRRKTPKYQVDEKFALRTRLFDQLIHDYDRHDDQFRWATFKQEDGTVLLRPIPRDRDQAFFDLRGVIPWFLSRRWLSIQQRGFTSEIKDVPGEAFPGKNFDRTYLTKLDHDDWMEVALDMQARLTDEVIEEAFKIWPKKIYDLNAEKVMETLKGRRDNMHKHAEELYFFWAEYVDVTGTNKREDFEVNRLANGDVEVRVFHVDKNREKKAETYYRYFKKSETKEIRLYGLDNDDYFHLKGEGEKGIKIRIIGGDGDDEILDESKVKGRSRETVVYDAKNGIEFNDSDEIRNATSNELKINEYDRFEFYYNKYLPLIFIGRTIDDGLQLGGGVQFTRYKFRKKPYGVKHRFFGRFSTQTDALSLSYSSDFTRAFGELDFNPSVSFDRPFVFQYFGLGNETRDTAEDRSFNRVRLERFRVQTLFKKQWYNNRNFTRFGPFYENIEVENGRGRITDSDIFRENELGQKNIIGLMFDHVFNSLDNQMVPRSGIKVKLESTFYRNLSDDNGYLQMGASFTNFATIDVPLEITIGTRLGLATFTDTDFLFYHANNLGGNNYLRGFRNNRFTGQSIFYHNIDLRALLFYSKNKVAPFEFGLLGGFDYGRTWSEEADGGEMHYGTSAGIWFTPYKFAAVNAFYTFTEEGEADAFTFRLGFFF